jgi:hypothetical protein
MPKTKVKERYARILAEAARRGARDLSDGADRRGAPRVPVTVGEMSVSQHDTVTTVDISISGVCFLSERPFTIGSDVELSVASAFSVSARVVGCVMEETDATFLETRYRIRCQFLDEEQGMEALVLAKERNGQT